MRCADWTLNISDFGKIKRATITMAPLVILVGRNNTGKSYAASLIWALLNTQQTIGRWTPESLPKWFAEFLHGTAESEAALVTLDERMLKELEVDFNERLKNEAAKLVQQLFSYSDMRAPSLSIALTKKTVGLKLTLTRSSATSSTFTIDDSENHLLSRVQFGSPDKQIAPGLGGLLFGIVIDAIFRGGAPQNGSVLYIPAARTGLMLTYRSLLSQLIGNLGATGVNPPLETQSNLPLPIIRFLQSLVQQQRPALPETKLERIAIDLEQSILSGNISSSRQPTPAFSYQPRNSPEQLPLHVTSSMVTELAPFLLLLKGGYGGAGIVFEEPEAHLHLSAQREMAKAIARIVNSGTPVVVTTHSDTFVQQINNLMQLHGHPDQALVAQFGYTAEDLIDPASARGYEFAGGDEGGTIVSELVKRTEGFVVPSLNDTLSLLATETLELQALDADDA